MARRDEGNTRNCEECEDAPVSIAGVDFDLAGSAPDVRVSVRCEPLS